MSTESGLWSLIRRSHPEGHWVRVENRVELGTPDVNFCLSDGFEGWVELKVVSRWPVRGGPLRTPHFTKDQRWWLRTRTKYGGHAGLLLRVDKGPKRYLMLPGAWAAEYLGEVTREVLEKTALEVWGPNFDKYSLMRGVRLL